jgi:hypothetical protein
MMPVAMAINKIRALESGFLVSMLMGAPYKELDYVSGSTTAVIRYDGSLGGIE